MVNRGDLISEDTIYDPNICLNRLEDFISYAANDSSNMWTYSDTDSNFRKLQLKVFCDTKGAKPISLLIHTGQPGFTLDLRLDLHKMQCEEGSPLIEWLEIEEIGEKDLTQISAESRV